MPKKSESIPTTISTLIRANTTTSNHRIKEPYSDPVEEKVGVTPSSSGATTIDQHTNRSKRSNSLHQMTSRGEPSSWETRTLSKRRGVDDTVLSFDEAAKKRTVRRSEGKRAGSEASASLRTTFPKSDEVENGTSSRSVTSPRPSSSFSTGVRNIFRSRTKSTSIPFKAPRVSNEVIPEVDEFGRSDDAGPAIGAAPQRERKSSFFFNRSKTPPRPKVELEGVDAHNLRQGRTQRSLATAGGVTSAPLVRMQSHESADQKSGESGASHSTPPTTPPAREAATSDSIGVSTFGSGRSNMDRSLTLQALGNVAPSPYGTRRSSSSGFISPPIRSSSSGFISPAMRSIPAREPIGESSHEGSRFETPTPVRPESNMSGEVEAGTGFAYTTASPSTPRASVPKMWQNSRHSRPLEADENGMTTISGPSHINRQMNPSTTSGSVSSYRTAKSSPRETISNIDLIGVGGNSGIPRPRREVSLSPTKTPKSPLSDLILNLEQRLSSTQSRSDPRDSSGEMSAPGPALAAGPDSPSFTAHGHAAPPYTTARRLEDDGESLSSSSQSSHSRRRDTFGGGVVANEHLPYSPDRWTKSLASTIQREGSITPPTRRAVGDMSMSEIEDSLAAVEAALQDHSLEGSFDPTSLRRRILTPRRASMMETEGVMEDSFDDFEMLSSPRSEARITLPPGQEVAIADAIKQVRRAISSSQLPQIPNEDDSISDTTSLAKPSPDQTLRAPPFHSSHQRESTPMRAARVRQESMQDVEEAYGRMLDLVGTATGIDVNSPMPNVRRKSNQSQQLPSTGRSGAGNLSYHSPEKKALQHSGVTNQQYVRNRTQSAAPVPSSTRSSSSSRAARQQLLRESDALARAVALGRISQVNMPRETDEPALRGRTSNLSLGSRRVASESPPRRRLESVGSNGTKMSQLYQSSQQPLSQQRSKSKRVSIEQPTSSSANGSGGGTAAGTSPSATVKTQGTPTDQYSNFAVMHSNPHSRSHSQQIHEWNRSRFSSSPSSIRPVIHSITSTQGKHFSNESSEMSSLLPPAEVARRVEEQRRKTRAYMSGGSGSSNQFPHSSSSPAIPQTSPIQTFLPALESQRRPGSIREWSRGEDGLIYRPPSGASNYSNALQSQTVRSARPTNGTIGEDGVFDMYESRERSQRRSSPPPSLLALQKRHNLERDSLLDMLERSRNEAVTLRARNEELEADLHQEVTRVLELQRELTRKQDNEVTMLDKISRLEEELKNEHADRIRIAELLERVQQAVDNAAKADAEDEGDGEEERGIPGRSPSESSISLRQEDLHPASMRILDTGAEYAGSTLKPSVLNDLSRRSPSLRSYPSTLGLVMDDQEMSWSLEQEQPIEGTGMGGSTSSHEPAAVDQNATATTKQPPTTPPTLRSSDSVASSKRFSFPATSTRLPLPTNMTPRSPPASTFSKSISSASTVLPSTSTIDDRSKRLPSSSPSSSTRTGGGGGGLADRFGGSMIARRKNHQQRPSVGGGSGVSNIGGTSIASSSSPQSLRNLSTSSSTVGRSGIPTSISSPTWRKASGASRFTSATGDTSLSARTVERVDMSRLDSLSDDDSYQ